jgi:hypothetical protein
MEHKIEKESHSLGIMELDNFIKIIVYLPDDLFFKIVVKSQNYTNRFEYERIEISKFRNEIFYKEDNGVFLFSNETDYKLFLLNNKIQFNSTDEWCKVVFIKIGSGWPLDNKSSVINYIENRSNDFQYKYSIRRQIDFCKNLVKKDNDFQICPYHPNSIGYLDWAIDVVEIDDDFYYVDFRYTPRNMITTYSFYETYMSYLNKYKIVEKNRRPVLSIQKNQINEALAVIKNVIKIDLYNLKIGEKSYWRARSFED